MHGSLDRPSHSVKGWLQTSWPFASVVFPGREMSWDDWRAKPDWLRWRVASNWDRTRS